MSIFLINIKCEPSTEDYDGYMPRDFSSSFVEAYKRILAYDPHKFPYGFSVRITEVDWETRKHIETKHFSTYELIRRELKFLEATQKPSDIRVR